MGSEGVAPPFLASALDAGERSASHPWHFTLGETAPAPIGEEAGWAPEPIWPLWIREISCPCQESSPGRPTRSPSQYRLSYPGSQSTRICTVIKYVRFEVLTTVRVIKKNTVFWDMTACSLLDMPNVSEDPAASIFGIKTLVNIHQTTMASHTRKTVVFHIFYSYHLACGHGIIMSFLTWLAYNEGYLSASLCDDKHCKTAV
jgi:hypothetical protein